MLKPIDPPYPWVDKVAKLLHEAYRALYEASGEKIPSDWGGSTPEEKNWLRSEVVFFLNHPAYDEAAYHEAWVASRVAAGWEHGEILDSEKKLSPYIAPYRLLSPFQRAKAAVGKNLVLAAYAEFPWSST